MADEIARDLERLRSIWPILRDAIWPLASERAMFNQAELVDVDGPVLVVQIPVGTMWLLRDGQKRAAEHKVRELLGQGTGLRLIDDTSPYIPRAVRLDPVIVRGLELFGGPLVCVSDDDGEEV